MANDNRASEYFGRRLRDQHAIGVSDDDEAIADLLAKLMDVELDPVKPTI